MTQPPVPLIGLIASKNPAPALEATVRSLFQGGASRVVVVDDGSDDKKSQKVFARVEKLGARVIHLQKNIGKANALKRGFRTLPKDCIIIQTDDDTLAGNLAEPAELIRTGKADVVDIRCESVRTDSLLGHIQELNYWVVNATTKRVQGYLGARLWMSGASVMYSYEAGRVIILEPAHSLTEDTEGLFRARSKGFRARYYAGHDAQFLTMVPEDVKGLHKQWRRWTTGNAQVLGVYGLGGGNARVATVNAYYWLQMLVPIPAIMHFGILEYAQVAFGFNLMIGVIGAVRLRRMPLVYMGMFLPFITLLWAYHAFQGLYAAYKLSRSGEKLQFTWVSPKRTAMLKPYAA